MLDAPSPAGSGRRRRTRPSTSPTRSTMQRLVVPKSFEDPRQAPELHVGDGPGQLAHAQVLAGERLAELLATGARVAGHELPALIRVPRRSEVQRFVVGDDEAPLAGRDVLLLLQREGTERAERAEMPSVIRRAHRLRGVFDDGYVVTVGDVQHGVEIARDVLEMDGDDRRGAIRDAGGQQRGIETERVVDLGEHRHRIRGDRPHSRWRRT